MLLPFPTRVSEMTDPNSLTITSLRWDTYTGEKSSVPYIVANITWKVNRQNHDGESLWQQMKSKSEAYTQVTTTGTPDEESALIEAAWGESGESVGGWIEYMNIHSRWGKAWTHQDEKWQYIEKFDTFWLREWCSDCGIVREALKELEYFRKTGKTLYTYRGIDDGVMLRHLETIHDYWD